MRELEDPQNTQKTMHSIYVDCDSCGHCGDTHSPTEGQPQALTDAQHQAADIVNMWITDAQAARLARENEVTFTQ